MSLMAEQAARQTPQRAPPLTTARPCEAKTRPRAGVLTSNETTRRGRGRLHDPAGRFAQRRNKSRDRQLRWMLPRHPATRWRRRHTAKGNGSAHPGNGPSRHAHPGEFAARDEPMSAATRRTSTAEHTLTTIGTAASRRLQSGLPWPLSAGRPAPQPIRCPARRDRSADAAHQSAGC
jgi:hypothetical protein